MCWFILVVPGRQSETFVETATWNSQTSSLWLSAFWLLPIIFFISSSRVFKWVELWRCTFSVCMRFTCWHLSVPFSSLVVVFKLNIISHHNRVAFFYWVYIQWLKYFFRWIFRLGWRLPGKWFCISCVFGALGSISGSDENRNMTFQSVSLKYAFFLLLLP